MTEEMKRMLSQRAWPLSLVILAGLGCAGAGDAAQHGERADDATSSASDARTDAASADAPEAQEPDFGNARNDGGGVIGGGAGKISTTQRVDGGGSGDDTCDLGEAGSFATDQSLDLFGQIVYFGGGKSLPKGRYRVQYVDGCMKYNTAQAWAVHASTAAPTLFAFWLVGETSAQKIEHPPGTTGYMLGAGGFQTFDECVAANLALPPLELDFAGGKLGVWLEDSPYEDNLAGEAGRNPKWSLTLLGECPELY